MCAKQRLDNERKDIQISTKQIEIAIKLLVQLLF